MSWLLALLGPGLAIPRIATIAALLCIGTAYFKGRNDGAAGCNAAALEAEATWLRRDIADLLKVAGAARDRAAVDAASISKLNDQVEELTHAFDTADNACRLTPDDARKLRDIR